MDVPGPTWDAVLRAPLNIDTFCAATSLFAMAIRPRLFGARAGAGDGLSDELRALFQASPSVLCLTDATGHIRAITPNAARILGDSCDRAVELGITTRELLQPEDPQQIEDMLDDLSRAPAQDTLTRSIKTRVTARQTG